VRDIARGQNLEYYVTLVFIVVIFAIDVFNLASLDALTNVILAVLALVVYSLLSTRQALEELSDKVVRPQDARSFFWKTKRSIEDDLSQAKDIRIAGAVLSRTLRDYRYVLEERLKHGAKVRIMLMDPNSTAPDQAVLRSKGVSNRQFYIDSLRPTIERISALVEASEKIELGLLPYKPAYGMILIDPDEAHGKIIIEMYPHHSDTFAPTFELFPNRDTHWAEFFRSQFDTMWSRSKHYQNKEIQNLVNQFIT
jgi:hypothetical protein